MNRARKWPVAALAAVLACTAELQTGLTPSEQLAVLQYLDCIDCVTPLDSVRALASRKPDVTVDSINRGLVLGPGLQAIAAAESVLVIGYVRDSTWRARNGLLPPVQRIRYVSEARARWENGYRSRGAYGLGWIHTPRAVAYLDSALALPLPPSVLEAVRYARDSLPPPR